MRKITNDIAFVLVFVFSDHSSVVRTQVYFSTCVSLFKVVSHLIGLIQVDISKRLHVLRSFSSMILILNLVPCPQCFWKGG